MNDLSQMPDTTLKSKNAAAFLADIDKEVTAFEKSEAARLDLNQAKSEHWFDANPSEFTAAQRAHTTILHAGLTMSHDLFIQSAFRGLGYKVEAMDVPDNRSLQFGREFGNRGQCNPTYFTVGNLIKKLKAMESDGLSKKDIIENYIFATAGACGPCRFGTYVTEYRKALRDAGFEGFRVLLFQQSGGIKQATGQDMGLKIDGTFFLTMVKAIVLGDVLNAMMYRVRPYEVNQGETDRVLAEAKQKIARAFETRKGLLKALWQTRKAFQQIQVDRTQVKPRVAIIGEFWAMTTEGDGNYKMHRFLEQEGAEVDIQLVVNWGLYLVWCAQYDLSRRAELKGTDSAGTEGSKFALENVQVGKQRAMLKAAEWVLRGTFYSYAKLLGLKDYHLPDMDHIADISHAFYDNNLRGGEGHMEVGKLIHNVVDQKVNMTLSIKPFGCMPSSSVSDGVQSLITELYPAAIFLPIETNGDGAVNVYSRVQMQLFKAKQSAEKEVQAALDERNTTMASFQAKVQQKATWRSAPHRSAHYGACTTVDLINEVYEDRNIFDRALGLIKHSFGNGKKQHTLNAVAKAADNYKNAKTAKANQANDARYDAVKIMEPS